MAGNVNLINIDSGNNLLDKYRNTSASISDLIDAVNDFKDGKVVSLPAYIKQAFVASRVYIQEDIINEPILPDLLNTLHQLYISFILAAVRLSDYVGNSKTKARDMLRIVASEKLNQEYENIEDLLPSFNTFVTTAFKQHLLNTAIEKVQASGNNPTAPKDKSEPNTNSRIIDRNDKTNLLPAGRLVEITFNRDPENKSSDKFTFNIIVSLLPSLIPSQVFKQFFATNFKLSTMQRFLKWRVGEISFFGDFLFELDQRNERREAMKKDKTGILYDMYKKQSKDLNDSLQEYVRTTDQALKQNGVQDGLRDATMTARRNIASTIQILEKRSFDVWCKETGCDFKIKAHRDRYFTRTMCMMIAIVDTDYQIVNMYFNGIDMPGAYSFNMLKSQSKNETYDLSTIMKSFTNVTAPRF